MIKNKNVTTNTGFFTDFATQPFCIFLKANIFLKTGRKKLQTFLISKFWKAFLSSKLSSCLAGLFLTVIAYANEAKFNYDVKKDSPID